jgi:chorismate synthase
MDHYAQINKEVVSLWESLRQKSNRHREINHKISNISNIATSIGGQIQVDAHQLERDVRQFLEGKLDSQAVVRMFRDALKLEQETREL